MLVTDLGIVTNVKPVQPANAASPMVVTDLGIETVFTDAFKIPHTPHQSVPTTTVLSGIAKLCVANPVHPSKARSPM